MIHKNFKKLINDGTFFEVLNDPLRELKAFLLAWSFFMEA